MCVQVQEKPIKNGYNAAQADSLKGRMRNVPTEEKWKIIWKVLFPDDHDHAIPPPCEFSPLYIWVVEALFRTQMSN